jgi:tripartite-type tricarboxylate transporter receptor subunit TctC
MTASIDSKPLAPEGALGRRPVLAYLAGSSLWATSAHAQINDNYPSRPIKMIVSFAPGSATDTVARVFGQKMAAILGQAVVVENRPGAVGIIGADAVAKAQNDGYTLLVGTNTTNAAVKALVKTVPYDPEKDFTPISFLGVLPQVLMVNPERPFKTLAELLARAREKPNTLTYSWTSSVTRVSAELLASMAKVSFVNVPYRPDQRTGGLHHRRHHRGPAPDQGWQTAGTGGSFARAHLATAGCADSGRSGQLAGL